jgi:acetylornithine deacetylase/succinyl-diaminopimelate desuccinylase-like protein
LIALSACAAGAGSPALMRDVRRLADPSLGGREAGTDDERAAADFVAAELRKIGLEPHVQPVDYGGGSQNVWALIPGTGSASDDVIVVGAHLDHLGRRDGQLYPGADDDASGVATVLATARELAQRRGELGRSILIVFFGAEEAGMVGSRAFVDE